jgi:hypothetical protein
MIGGFRHYLDHRVGRGINAPALPLRFSAKWLIGRICLEDGHGGIDSCPSCRVAIREKIVLPSRQQPGDFIDSWGKVLSKQCADRVDLLGRSRYQDFRYQLI